MTRAAPLAAALLLAGCAEAHRPRPDGGARDGGARDAGLDAPAPDARARDAGPPDAPGCDGPCDCSTVVGYRRCDERCPLLCPDRIRCTELVGLCLPYDVTHPFGRTGSCRYDLDPQIDIENHCADSRPCALRGPAPAGDDTGGLCVPLAVCLDGPAAGLPPFHCVWTDLTPVTRSPPPASCPPPANPRAHFCAAACPSIECPGFCFGVSDTRGFGVCVWPTVRCHRDSGPSGSGYHRDCRTEFGETCACVVARPQPEGNPYDSGYLTARSTCLVYRDAFPTGVECRDEDWNLIP